MTHHRSVARTLVIVFGGVGIVVCAALIVVAIHFAFFSNQRAGASTEHPSAARVVQRYLAAIAAGDAHAAESLDSGVREKAPYSGSDQQTFLTDDALSAATSRISRAASKVTLATATSATVRSSWMLAGKHYSHLFSLRWGSSSARWILEDSLANVVTITTLSPEGQSSPAFTLGGIPSGTSASYVVYPGVYRLDVDVPKSAILNPAKTPTSRNLLIPPFDAVPMARVNFLLNSTG
jgi:hypothetical protein